MRFEPFTLFLSLRLSYSDSDWLYRLITYLMHPFLFAKILFGLLISYVFLFSPFAASRVKLPSLYPVFRSLRVPSIYYT